MISSHVGNLMDMYSTVLEMAGLQVPANYTQDGASLTKTLFDGFETDERPVFYYRGDTLFKVRYGQYKAHLYTWGTPSDAGPIGYDYCPGQHVQGITTPDMRNYTMTPVLFHLGRDPGEKFKLSSGTEEYRTAMQFIAHAVKQHEATLVKATPQFNRCDLAAQNWKPNGCEKINRCLDGPPSKPYDCNWPY